MRILTPALLLLPLALSAQTPITVTTAQGNGQQTWYSLENGVVDSRPLAEWDIAIEITGITGGILANTAKGVRVYKAPYSIAQWAALDTTGLAAGWPQQHNSETDWSSGAFNQGLTSNPFDLGWGIYNMITHNVTGDSCFVIMLANGDWKKIRIDGYASATDTYTWTLADLDGGAELSNTLVRAQFAGRNFGYVSLENNTVFDREPPTAGWDLLFTRYMAFVPFPQPSMYAVAGVLQNRGITAQRVNGVDPSFSDWGSGAFNVDINVIGFDWKTFNQQTFQWEYATDRVHFVKNAAGAVYKLVFTVYGGSATGDMTFTQELMSATGIDERGVPVVFSAWPNPVEDGRLNLLLDAPAANLELQVFDASGRLVMSDRIAQPGNMAMHTVDVSSLATGVHTLRVLGQGTVATTRIVVR